ncbi:MAG: tyrosine--tRNA ligase [Alphaproteobacteria bacterium]
METYQSDFLKEVTRRGFIYQGTDLRGLDQKLCEGCVVAYAGFDATAPSLHVGHLLPIMLFKWFQKTGHKPLVLLGGATTKVGDPTGKDSARQLLSDETIAANMASLGRVFERFLTFGHGQTDAKLLNNSDWLEKLSYIDFLRDVGTHFTVNRMLSFESVKLRLEREQPLSFIEFNYMLLQSYDFFHLAETHQCTLQLGGSDQWGNIVSGVDFTRRRLSKEVFGLTCPLMTTADGSKMGKTAQGKAIWLNPDQCSPYDYWQFWRNTHDQDVGRFLKLFTFLPMDEIERLEKLQSQDINEAKKILADEATRILHGADVLPEIHTRVKQAFDGVVDDASGYGVGATPVYAHELALITCLEKAGLVASKGEARRLIRAGGVRVQDQPISDELFQLTQQHFANGPVKLSAGRKHHIFLELINGGEEPFA